MKLTQQYFSNPIVRLIGQIDTVKKTRWLLVLLLSIVVIALEFLVVGSFIPLLQTLIGSNDNFDLIVKSNLSDLFDINFEGSMLNLYGFTFITALGTATAARILLIFQQNVLGNDVAENLSCKMYSKVLHWDYTKFLSSHSPEVITNICMRSYQIGHNLIIPLLSLATSLLVLITVFVCALSFFNYSLVVPVLVVMASYCVTAIFIKSSVSKAGQRVAQSTSKIVKLTQDTMGGFQAIRLNNQQSRLLQQFATTAYGLKKAHVLIQTISVIPKYLIEFFGMFAIVLLAMIIGDGSTDSAFIVASLGSIALSGQRLLPFFQQTFNSWVQIRGIWESLLCLLELIETPAPFRATSPKDDSLADTDIDLRLNDIEFGFHRGKPSLLSGANFSIKSGEFVGIIGQTGVGKSTFIDIILGLLQPSRGTVRINGEELKEFGYGNWWRLVAHVPQEIFLFNTSIAENISLKSEMTEDEIQWMRKVIDMCQLTKLVESLKDGIYETVGERGKFISGGQIQRIGLARALYQKPKLLILDEGTSALDEVTEEKILAQIKLQTTDMAIIMITHRNDSLRHCSSVYKILSAKVSIN